MTHSQHPVLTTQTLRGISIVGAAIVWCATGCAVDVDPGKPASGAVGAACSTVADCTKVNAPVCLSLTDNGYCSASCAALGQTICPTGSLCLEFPGDVVLCMDGCTDNSDCRDGFVCAPAKGVKGVNVKQFGVCLARCESNSDCGFGEACHFDSGKCVPKVGGTGKTGHACSTDTDCNQDLCLVGWAGGYCSSTCAGGGGTSCEAGAICSTVQNVAGLCLQACSTSEECRPGYRCDIADSSTTGVCVPRCDSTFACNDGFHCDLVFGTCVAGPATPQPIGGFCTSPSHCVSNTCNTEWPNGICTAPCDPAPCPEGLCYNGTCVMACASGYDCRPDYACGPAKGCIPHCQNLGCSSGQRCDTLSGLCLTNNAGGFVVETLFSGPVSTAPLGGAETTVVLPDDVLSLSVYGGDGNNTPTRLYELGRKDKVPLFSLKAPSILDLPLYSAGNPDFSVLLPQAPALIPTPGEWTVTLSRTGLFNTTAPLTAMVVRGPGPPETGRLPLHFYLVGVPGITAQTATQDLFIEAVIKKVSSIFAEAYLEIGEVYFYDITGPNADRLSVVDTIYGANSEFAELMELAQKNSSGIDIFLVNEILGSKSGFSLLGLSGGIPGPATAHGLATSGIVISLGFYYPKVNSGFKDQQVRQLGQTIAHETGHYLGLFHTSEGRGLKHDPLSDTPKCLPKHDKNGDGYLFGGECAGKGAENLMFWASAANAETISLEQGAILLRNPNSQLPVPADTR